MNWLPDRDQVVRRVPLLVRLKSAIFPSFALEALRVAQGATTIIVRSSNASGQTAFGQQSGVNALRVGDLEIQTGPSADIVPIYDNPAGPVHLIRSAFGMKSIRMRWKAGLS